MTNPRNAHQSSVRTRPISPPKTAVRSFHAIRATKAKAANPVMFRTMLDSQRGHGSPHANPSGEMYAATTREVSSRII